MAPWNPCPRLAPTVFLASCLFTAQLRGQDPGGSPTSGTGHSHGMRGFQHGAFDPVLLDGPPAPGDFATVVSPDTVQASRYESLYTNLMAATHDDRDSLRQVRIEMRAARESQDHESMRRSGTASQQLVTALQSSQQAFDQALKAMLTGPQFQRYEDWASAATQTG